MPDNRETRILQAYVDYLNGIFNQTITDSRLSIIARHNRLIISRYRDGFLPLELKPKGYLHFRQLARVERGKVIVEDYRYIYSFSANPDEELKWIFRYEYSLTPAEKVPHAHIHINAYWDNNPLKHIHFPTGRLSVEQIITHLILEHGVTSKTEDWLNSLANSHFGFTKRRNDFENTLFP